MLKLVFFVPDSHLEAVKQAVFEQGAGAQGDYSHCAFQVLGRGQFLPGQGAVPAIGARGVLEQVEEWRVEVLVAEPRAKDVKQALVKAHPYETPAFEFVQLVEI